ncbi:hypothetical protein ACFYP4_02745 [Streptomyces sp. NPDC005551]|uniref:hypothetical protein n=1 Tax=Streptomyces sp. NPDC005551 TaxID=3364725 RepID=UPI003695E758
MSWEQSFQELADYYPGSSKRIEAAAPKPKATAPEPHWSDHPRVYSVDGKDYEFFTVRDLAAALQKAPVTIRLWESQGYLPMPLRGPSEHPSKRHRIYTRPQIEGIVRIAHEVGIFGQARPRVSETDFREKVLDLFLELARTRPLSGAVLLEEAA